MQIHKQEMLHKDDCLLFSPKDLQLFRPVCEAVSTMERQRSAGVTGPCLGTQGPGRERREAPRLCGLHATPVSPRTDMHRAGSRQGPRSGREVRGK